MAAWGNTIDPPVILMGSAEAGDAKPRHVTPRTATKKAPLVMVPSLPNCEPVAINASKHGAYLPDWHLRVTMKALPVQLNRRRKTTNSIVDFRYLPATDIWVRPGGLGFSALSLSICLRYQN